MFGFGFILLALAVFAVVSTVVYYKDTDPTKSVSQRFLAAVKMGAVAVIGVISAWLMQWTSQ